MQVSCERKRQTYNENGQGMRFYANNHIALTPCKPETKKTGESSNACVCVSPVAIGGIWWA